MDVGSNVVFSFLKHGHHRIIIEGIIGNYLKKKIKKSALNIQRYRKKIYIFFKYPAARGPYIRNSHCAMFKLPIQTRIKKMKIPIRLKYFLCLRVFLANKN
jgi:hypothetical protein